MRRGAEEKSERPALSAYRLPAGRHGIPSDQVAENQRWRLLGAAAEVLGDQGYASMTSARVARHAHVSSATFYEQFGNVEACLLASYEMAASCVMELALDACETDQDWPVRLRAAIDAILDFLASEPVLCRLLGTEAAAGVAVVGAARERLIEQLAGLLRTGREGMGRPPELPLAHEERLVGGVFTLLSDRLVAGQIRSLRDLAPELAEILA